jgi:hypothetical protein
MYLLYFKNVFVAVSVASMPTNRGVLLSVSPHARPVKQLISSGKAKIDGDLSKNDGTDANFPHIHISAKKWRFATVNCAVDCVEQGRIG